uniref:Sechitinase 13 n=1 Tax=Spodoptera exigua TaxID=7107 RepID=A0A4P8PR27_SPOEX|nr:sechitinase 13 [Spodoptera exigua]
MKDTAVFLLCTVAVAYADLGVINHDGCPMGSILLPHENCNQFYDCTTGALVVRNCPPGLHFNPSLGVCDWPVNAKCDSSLIKNTKDVNEICSSVSDGVFLAHENCDQFYTCSEGKPVQHKCAPGLLFNPDTMICDWEKNVKCGDRMIPGGEKKSDKVCSDSHYVVFAHENCNQFYDCTTGALVVRNCPPGLHFNPSLGVCDWPVNAKCDSSLIKNTKDVNEICSSVSDGVFLAHENCDQFYTCSEGKPVQHKCAPGLLFNPDTMICDWEKNVKCGDRMIPGGEKKSDKVCSDSHYVVFAHENCNQFYDCTTGALVVRNCPPGLHFNPSLGVCDWPVNAKCDSSLIKNTKDVNEICSSDSDGVFVAHENCNQFYQCLGGQLQQGYCPRGLHFNTFLGICDWPKNVDCGNRLV